MKFVKYFVGPEFDKAGFCNLLWHDMNVRCREVDDGVVLDLDAFNAMPAGRMPVWAWQNRDDINSRLHTREANFSEWPELTPKTRYSLAIVLEDSDAFPLENAAGLEYMKEEAEEVASAWECDPAFRAVVVLDNETGRVVYSV